MAQSLVDGPSLMVSPKVQYWAQYCFTYAAITWTKEQRPSQQAHWQHKSGSSDQYPRDLCSPSEELQHVGEMGREQPSEQSCGSVTLWISYEKINIKKMKYNFKLCGASEWDSSKMKFLSDPCVLFWIIPSDGNT